MQQFTSRRDAAVWSKPKPLRSTVLAVILSLCPPPDVRDKQPPWDGNRMARDIAPDLQRYEGLRGEFERVEVLAWRHEEMAAPPIPMRRYFVDIALVWGRTGTFPPRWVLVQVFNQARCDRHAEGGVQCAATDVAID